MTGRITGSATQAADVKHPALAGGLGLAMILPKIAMVISITGIAAAMYFSPHCPSVSIPARIIGGILIGGCSGPPNGSAPIDID